MQLGVTIPLADLETMRQHLERMPLKNIVFQMRVGLGGYRNNGEEWDFRSPTTFGILERNTSVHRQTGKARPRLRQVWNVMLLTSSGGKGSPVSGQRGMLLRLAKYGLDERNLLTCSGGEEAPVYEQTGMCSCLVDYDMEATDLFRRQCS